MNKVVFLVMTRDYGRGFKILGAYSNRSKAQEAMSEFAERERLSVEAGTKSASQEDDFVIHDIEVL